MKERVVMSLKSYNNLNDEIIFKEVEISNLRDEIYRLVNENETQFEKVCEFLFRVLKFYAFDENGRLLKHYVEIIREVFGNSDGIKIVEIMEKNNKDNV